MGLPGSVSHASPLKKPFSSNIIAPPKFPRSGGSVGPKSWIEENMFRTDSNSNTLLPLQVNILVAIALASVGSFCSAANVYVCVFLPVDGVWVFFVCNYESHLL